MTTAIQIPNSQQPQLPSGWGAFLTPQLLAMLIPLIAGLIGKAIETIGSRPSSPTDPPIMPDIEGEDDTDVIPNTPNNPAIRRVPAELRANYSGITRKNTPYKEEGGRKRLGTQAFRRVMPPERADPLQAGDVVDENITPYDQFGKPFLSGEGVNDLLLRPDGFPGFRHTISGKGYLVREAPKPSDPYGCTPGIRIPSTFQDSDVKPGFEGEVSDHIELHLDANGRAVPEGETGVTILTVDLPALRIRPWKA